ncbi:hypothetical protein RHSIM_Rhsim06G0157000 [Rhododendron simsii]|uniref:Uncharacterized protein n=1 Tax=Rhododendron simsii TaxID=118357 RepID=A0A834LLN2_RHOSS|nr:hypothetical protein RHSIM_Rhsim06G0157000 [Rhododendron simsii]
MYMMASKMPENTSAEPEGNLQQLIPEANELAAKLYSGTSDTAIFRFPRTFREGNEKYYKPRTMAIGPFHAQATDLNRVQTKMINFFCVMGQIGGEGVMKVLIAELERLELSARACYDPDQVVTKMKSYEFSKIMILDGCSVFLVIVQGSSKESSVVMPALGSSHGSVYDLPLDYVKLENQVPFFILESIYEKYKQANRNATSSLSEYALSFLRMTILKEHKLRAPEPGQRINHLLHLAKMALFPLPRPDSASTMATVVSMGPDKPSWSSSSSSLTETRSASELKAYGVNFQTPKVGNNAYLQDIRFLENGVLEIPKLVYNEITAPLFLNFLAYEVSYHNMEEHAVISYIWFMDSLIRDVKDVEVLVQSGVLQARITDAKDIVSLFNSLAGSLFIMPESYHFEHIHRQLKRYCESGPRPLRAKWVYFYNHGRWDFLNTILLSFFTVTQTLFSILAYLIPLKNK